MTVCEQAAAESSWIRHMDQALEQSREREPAQAPAITGTPVLVAIEGSRPERAPKESRHPSLRGDIS